MAVRSLTMVSSSGLTGARRVVAVGATIGAGLAGLGLRLKKPMAATRLCEMLAGVIYRQVVFDGRPRQV